MRVLNVSTSDYANMSHNNARALRSIGVACDDVKTMKHVFKYASESRVVPLQRYPFNLYDVIQLFHSDIWLLQLIQRSNFKGKLIVYHTGTRYRQESKRYNEFFNKSVYRCVTDQTEFMHLGGKRIEYLAPHIDYTKVPKRPNGRLIIGHFPSNPEQKGTSEIIEMLQPFKNNYELRVSTAKVSHKQQIQRMAACHVYIELFKAKQEGKEYGCYGVTAFEAAALGCLVVTQNLYPDIYERTYGYPPFYYANTRDDFEAMLKELEHIDRSRLVTPDSFYLRHNIESTGYRILNLIQ